MHVSEITFDFLRTLRLASVLTVLSVGGGGGVASLHSAAGGFEVLCVGVGVCLLELRCGRNNRALALASALDLETRRAKRLQKIQLKLTV